MAEDYTIVGQGQGHATGPAGSLVDVWRVTVATLPEGIQFFVDIPLGAWRANPQGSIAAAVQPLVSAAKESLAL